MNIVWVYEVRSGGISKAAAWNGCCKAGKAYGIDQHQWRKRHNSTHLKWVSFQSKDESSLSKEASFLGKRSDWEVRKIPPWTDNKVALACDTTSSLDVDTRDPLDSCREESMWP